MLTPTKENNYRIKLFEHQKIKFIYTTYYNGTSLILAREDFLSQFCDNDLDIRSEKF